MAERTDLLAHARKCRVLARSADPRTTSTLLGMAREYEIQAARLPSGKE